MTRRTRGSLSDDQLLKIVQHEAFAFELPIRENLEVCEWTYEPHYPVRRFTDRPLVGFKRPWKKRDWQAWYLREKKMHEGERPGYFKQLEDAWLLNPDAVGPVVVVEVGRGAIDIGDGWHRIAMLVSAGKKTVPAVIGRCDVSMLS